MTTQKNKLFENLRKDDLFDLVDNNIEIDRYRSKMGDDDDIVVLAFKALHQDAAKDLVDFVETGYEWVLDANTSPATDSKGKVTVFVEFERRTSLVDRIIELTDDISKLCSNEYWTFTYYKSEAPLDVTVENLKLIPNSPREYRKKLMQEQEMDNMMMSAGLDPTNRYKKTIEDKDISFLKALANIK
jgi:hypothetical protein